MLASRLSRIVLDVGMKQHWLMKFKVPLGMFECRQCHTRSQERDVLRQHISQLVSPESILNEMPSLVQHGALGGCHVTQMIDQLVHGQYQVLETRLEWLQRNRNIAYIQLLLEERIQSLMCPVLYSTGFLRLCQLVVDKVEELSQNELTKTLLALLYLGIDHSHLAVHHLLQQCHQQLHHFDIHSLRDLSYIYRTFRGLDTDLLKGMMKRHSELVSNSSILWTPDELANECNFVVNTLKFISAPTSQIVTKLVLELIQDPAYMTDINYIGSYIRMAQKVFTDHFTEKALAREIISCASKQCFSLVDSIQSHNVAEICHAMKKARCYDRKMADIFEQRAALLLLNTNRMSDISNLMYALGKSTNTVVMRQFENALLPKLMSGCVDLIVLSNLADNLDDTNCKNKDVILRFQQLVVENADNLLSYASRYQRVVKYLVRHPFINPQMATTFSEKLLHKLHEKEGLHMYSVSNLAMFLLPNSHNALPDVLYRQLLQAIPKWQEQELYRFALGLNSMRQPLTGLMKRQLADIQACLHTHLADRLNHVSNLDYLYQLTLSLVVHNRQRDPILTDRMMEMFTHFTGNLTDVSMLKVCQVFTAMAYHLPQVYNDITSFLVQKQSHMDIQCILDVVRMHAQVGHQPIDGDLFLAAISNYVEDVVSAHKVREGLQLLHSLATIQLFPEQALSHVFSLDFIEAVDACMEAGKAEHRRELERLMMELNRCVVLECPQLDVPWFHEQYCQQQQPREPGGLAARFADEVEEALADTIGKNTYPHTQMYKRWTQSAYGHTINFECFLDEGGKPVNFNHQELTPLRPIQSVAVLCLGENAFCHNSRHLLGWHQQKIRQLQIMGYKVVEIPYYDWHSMALSEWAAKVDFLQDKLLS